MRLRIAVLTAALAVLQGVTAHAQDRYPSRPITMLFPQPTGGFDVIPRAFADALGRTLGQPIVFLNRDGASGRIAFELLASAKPDGYTIAFSPSSPIALVPHLQKGISYGMESFDFICQVFENTLAVSVSQESPFASLTQLVEFARVNPGKLSYGHPGVGSSPHLMSAGFAQQLGIKVLAVPYRGGNQMLTALRTQEIDFSAPGVGSIANRKDLRMLAVFAANRHPAFPTVPTVSELGLPGVPSDPQGVYAPKGLSKETLASLEQGCKAATGADSLLSLATNLYQTIAYLPSAEFRKRNFDDFALKEGLLRSLNIKPE